MIDNFDLIKSLIDFGEDSGLFCHLQIIRRGKDHPDLPAANKTIQTWLVKSPEHLDKLKEDVIFLCEHYQARAYINVTPKLFGKLNTLIMCKLSENIHNGNIINPWHIYNSAIGELQGIDKRWIVDIDTKEQSQIDVISDVVKRCKGSSGQRIIATVPTLNGVHLITRSFDLKEFRAFSTCIDVHKNNPTILYIPKSLEK